MAEDDAAVGGRMEAISSSKIYMDLLEGKISNCCEYYSKPEADAVIARLKSELTAIANAIGSPKDVHRLPEAIKSVLSSYRKRGEIAEAKSSRLGARCGDLQDEVDRFRSVLKYVSEKRLGNYSHLDFYDIQEMAESALSGGR